MSLSDKLVALDNIKLGIKTAIKNKGVSVADDAAFDTYPAKINEIGNSAYVRPFDWLPLPELVEGQQKIVALYAVFDSEANFASVKVQGAYTIDWGDGTVENIASNVQANHNYNYASLPDSSICNRGYKQTIITITPQAGQNLTTVSFGVKHNQSGLADYSSGLLDVALVGLNFTYVSFQIWAGIRFPLLEKFTFIGQNNITSFFDLFNTLSGLKYTNQFYTTKGTDFQRFFASCNFTHPPLIDTSNGTTANNFFFYNEALVEIPAYDFRKINSFTTFLVKNTVLSLRRCRAYGMKVSISFANCLLSRTAIVEIFNNLASGVIGQTITLTGNYGVSSLTQADKDIALNKGWTLVL